MRYCPSCGTRFEEDAAYCPHDGMATRELPNAGTAPVDPLLGYVVDQRYRIERVLGEGGMGIVYLATHTMLGRKLALKVLRGEMARDQDVVQRFVQEAKAATSIGHENIISISDFGRLPDGAVYFAMEYLDGESLSQLIARGGSIPVRDALSIIRQMASALGAAHARGIVHRDLKPDNIYILPRGEEGVFVKVLDFGIAKVGGAASKLTRTGMIFGTPHYMSPEQAAGQSVDQRTDIYALGVIMYEIFTGRVPFDADTYMAILSKHMFEAPIPPSQVAAQGRTLGAIEVLIMRALVKKPELRYQSMGELLADLDSVAAGGQIQLPGATAAAQPGLADALEPPSRTEMNLNSVMPPPELPKSNTLLVVGVAAGALLLAGAIAVGVAVFSGEETATAAPPVLGPVPASGPASALAPGPTTPVSANADAREGAGTRALANVPSSAPSAPSAPEVAAVRIESQPPGAQILRGGAALGTTPFDFPRPTGAVAEILELRLGGYETHTVIVDANTTPPVVATLHKAPPRRAAPPVRTYVMPGATSTGSSAGTSGSSRPGRQRTTTEVLDPWSN